MCVFDGDVCPLWIFMVLQILCAARESSQLQGDSSHPFEFNDKKKVVGHVQYSGPNDGWVASWYGSNVVSIAFIDVCVYGK